MDYIDETKTVITLPVPLGTVLYTFDTKCGDFCTFQREKFDQLYEPTPKGRCGRHKLCHTRLGSVSTVVLELSNIEFVLKDFGTWVFQSEEEARQKMEQIVSKNVSTMKQLGFKMNESGYGYNNPTFLKEV